MRSTTLSVVRRYLAVSLAMACVSASAYAQDAPSVVATVKPLHSLTAQVMEGIGTPALLIEGAASPHDYAMRPSDTRLLALAKLVVMVGGDFEAFLARPLKSAAGSVRVLELARVGGMQLPGGDQHLWLDPENAARAVEAIGRALSEVDPPRAYAYTRNAFQAKERIAALDRELRQVLAPVRDQPFIVYHDAFRAFARRYSLNLVGAVVSGAEHAAGAQHLADLARKASGSGARCVFTAPQFEPALARALAQSIGARLAELDDLGAAIPAGPEMYFTLMRGLAAGLRDCLGRAG